MSKYELLGHGITSVLHTGKLWFQMVPDKSALLEFEYTHVELTIFTIFRSKKPAEKNFLRWKYVWR